jgi:hypothetical protein
MSTVPAKHCPCGEPSEGWPGPGESELCQMCWEAQCDASWWRMVRGELGDTGGAHGANQGRDEAVVGREENCG